MPADTSDKSNNSASRLERAREQMKASLSQKPDGSGSAPTGQASQATEPRSRAPSRGSNDRLDRVLAAIAGEQPLDDQAKKRLEAGATEDAGREGDRSLQPPRNQDDRKPDRPAFEDDDDNEEVEDERKPRKIKTKSLTEFAEAVEVEPKAIYGLEVPLDEGEQPITIGALKDHYKATKDLDARTTEFEDYRTQAQNEIIRGRNELDGVLERIAEVLPQNQMAYVLDSVRGQAVETRARAAKELREFFPEWDDDDKRKAAGNKMRGWLESYGLPGATLDNIYDAKVIRMFWQMGMKAERYMRLRQGEREKKPSTEPRAVRRKPSSTPNETARSAAAKGDKVGAVAALLMGQSNGYDKSRQR